MTASSDPPETAQAMLEWMEGEMHQLKLDIAKQSEQLRHDHDQLWDLVERFQRSESGANNLASQMDALVGISGEVRGLRERVDRVQSLVAQDQEQTEHLARQLRAEMQGDRDARGRVLRQTESAERVASGVHDKLGSLDDSGRHLRNDLSLQSQRLDQIDITLAALDSRLAATGEAQRRGQATAESWAEGMDIVQRAAGDFGERLGIAEEQLGRVLEGPLGVEDLRSEFEVARERLEAIRITTEATAERSSGVARDHTALTSRLEDLDRMIERSRGKTDQQDRALSDLRNLVQEVRDLAIAEAQRFSAFQEKLRRRQIADLEQEVREIKGYNRPERTPNSNA